MQQNKACFSLGYYQVILSRLFFLVIFCLQGCEVRDDLELDEDRLGKIGVNGGGYLILDDQTNRVYARSAKIIIESDGQGGGYLVTEQGMNVQGFTADAEGNIGGVAEAIVLPVNDLSLIAIDRHGFVYATQAPKTLLISQIALASFNSPYNLVSEEKGIYAESELSGSPEIGAPSTGLLGEIDFPNGEVSELDYTLDLSVEDSYLYLENEGEHAYALETMLFVDKDRFLANELGLRLMVYPSSDPDVNGNQSIEFSQLQPLQLASDIILPRRTTHVDLVLNLNATATNTYKTSTTLFDSLGNPHQLVLSFSKLSESSDAWLLYLQIDNADVGDPVSGFDSPFDAVFELFFNGDGSLDQELSGSTIEISNWTPLDAEGNANGADGPLNVADFATGSETGVLDPPKYSNFTLNISGITQFSRFFEETTFSQNGYTTGRLSKVISDNCGNVIMSYSNGVNMEAGQIALANFANLSALEESDGGLYKETEASGAASFGVPCSDGFNTISGDVILR